MLIVHVPRNHFSETLFHKAIVQYTRNFPWMSDTYEGFDGHGIVPLSRENLVAFIGIVEQNRTAVSMAFLE